MTASELVETTDGARPEAGLSSLSTAAARNLATTTKSVPQIVQHEYAAGEVIVRPGRTADEFLALAHGEVNKLGAGEYGAQSVLGVLADGDYLGDRALTEPAGRWDISVQAATACIVLALPARAFREVLDQSPEQLPSTFVDDEETPREYHSPGPCCACPPGSLYPASTQMAGHTVPGWRDGPILPCAKIPISDTHTSQIIAMRTGEDEQGVIGLHQAGIPDEYQPSPSVRFMNIDEKAVMSYLVTASYPVAVLVPDALGILEGVQVGHYGDAQPVPAPRAGS